MLSEEEVEKLINKREVQLDIYGKGGKRVQVLLKNGGMYRFVEEGCEFRLVECELVREVEREDSVGKGSEEVRTEEVVGNAGEEAKRSLGEWSWSTELESSSSREEEGYESSDRLIACIIV